MAVEVPVPGMTQCVSPERQLRYYYELGYVGSPRDCYPDLAPRLD